MESVRRLAEASMAESTWATYKREWRLFCAFAAAENVPAMPASVELLACYIAWMAEMGRGGMVKVAVASIGKIHDLNGQKSPVGDRWLKLVVEGAERMAAKGKRMRQRDPLPVSAVRQFAGSKKGVHHARDLALVTLGMRGMRRASELRNLQLGDICIKGNAMDVWIARQKNDQKGRGQRVYIEATGTSTCPVGSMKEYLKLRGDGEGWLFQQEEGRQLSTGAITSIVRRVAAAAGLRGCYSSHSLRIGGATAAMAAGMTKEQVKAIGGWTSDAVDRYLRAVEPLQKGASRLMGL